MVKNKPSLCLVYEAVWYSYREDSRISKESEGYYLKLEDARKAIRRVRERDRRGGSFRFHSSEIVVNGVVEVNRQFYGGGLFGVSVIDIAKPSELENIVNKLVALDMGDNKIAMVYSSPLKIK